MRVHCFTPGILGWGGVQRCARAERRRDDGTWRDLKRRRAGERIATDFGGRRHPRDLHIHTGTTPPCKINATALALLSVAVLVVRGATASALWIGRRATRRKGKNSPTRHCARQDELLGNCRNNRPQISPRNQSFVCVSCACEATAGTITCSSQPAKRDGALFCLPLVRDARLDAATMSGPGQARGRRPPTPGRLLGRSVAHLASRGRGGVIMMGGAQAPYSYEYLY